MTKETGRRYIASNNFCGAPDQAEQCEERWRRASFFPITPVYRKLRSGDNIRLSLLERCLEWGGYRHVGGGSKAQK
jgi:hypothetical protein